MINWLSKYQRVKLSVNQETDCHLSSPKVGRLRKDANDNPVVSIYGKRYLCINMEINVGRRKDQQLRISPGMRYERVRILLNYKLVLNLVSGPQRSDLGCTAGLW